MAIVRDQWKIIIQHPEDKNSGGDSSRSVGLMALFGSGLDRSLTREFEIKPGYLTRHPVHYPEGDCFTRDQLICLTAGLWAGGHIDICRRVFWAHLKRGFFCQNYKTQFTRVNKGFFGRDPLSPSHIGHLILCGKVYWAYWFLLISYPWVILDIIWATKINPEMEQNQTVSMCVVYDLVWLWAFLSKDWEQSIRRYWQNWRDQKEIGDVMVDGIKWILSN